MRRLALGGDDRVGSEGSCDRFPDRSTRCSVEEAALGGRRRRAEAEASPGPSPPLARGAGAPRRRAPEHPAGARPRRASARRQRLPRPQGHAALGRRLQPRPPLRLRGRPGGRRARAASAAEPGRRTLGRLEPQGSLRPGDERRDPRAASRARIAEQDRRRRPGAGDESGGLPGPPRGVPAGRGGRRPAGVRAGARPQEPGGAGGAARERRDHRRVLRAAARARAARRVRARARRGDVRTLLRARRRGPAVPLDVPGVTRRRHGGRQVRAAR